MSGGEEESGSLVAPEASSTVELARGENKDPYQPWYASLRMVPRLLAATILFLFLLGTEWVTRKAATLAGFQHEGWVVFLTTLLTWLAVLEISTVATLELVSVLARSARGTWRELKGPER